MRVWDGMWIVRRYGSGHRPPTTDRRPPTTAHCPLPTAGLSPICTDLNGLLSCLFLRARCMYMLALSLTLTLTLALTLALTPILDKYAEGTPPPPPRGGVGRFGPVEFGACLAKLSRRPSMSARGWEIHVGHTLALLIHDLGIRARVRDEGEDEGCGEGWGWGWR